MKFNGFIAALLISIVIAWFFPHGPEAFPLKAITAVGISLIFFFYGLKLAPSELKKGLSSYRVHLLVQFSTFILFPILVLGFVPLFQEGTESDLWLALFFLAALPSTVSSSVVMVALAKGNVPAAIFNASLSGIIGVVITPLWMSLFLTGSSDFEFYAVFEKLFLQVLLPLGVGLVLQRFWGRTARRNQKKISFFDKSVIVLIVYSSFATAFTTQLFTSLALYDMAKLFGAVIGLFFMVYYLLEKISTAFKLDSEDQITAQFAGTKKSLVHGSVMVKIIFGNSAGNALFLLPVMLYHITQLLVIAIMAERYRLRDQSEAS